MPLTDRRRVRRAECRADRATDADVLAALKEVAVAIAALTDVVEAGLADIASSIRIQKEEL